MRDKKKQREWIKTHYKNIVGLRPLCPVSVQALTDGAGVGAIMVTARDFLFRKKGEKTYRVFSRRPDVVVHFPRSLGRRVRITVNELGTIVGETDKCFGK